MPDVRKKIYNETGDTFQDKNNVPKTGAEMCRFFLDKEKSK